MQVLRPNQSGDDVVAWQLFLRGQDVYEGETHGRYDEATVAATKVWQKQQGLLEDAFVGLKTYAKAQELGFNPGFEDHEPGDTGAGWPPKPGFAPLDPTARTALLGQFAFRAAPSPKNPEGIEITDNWAKDKIETVAIPLLGKLPGGPAGGKIRLHGLAVEPFAAFFTAVEKAGLGDRILSFSGSWVPRFIRGSTKTLSNHSYGSAIDINVPFNGLGTLPALKGKKGSVRELVPIANECGLYWGGHFAKRPDGMHFELARAKR
jgi:hypothetical protein